MKEFDHALEIMHTLRQQCPWDKEQTLKTLRSHLLEEAYECADAIDQTDKGNFEDLKEELGDLLLQFLFQAELLSEKFSKPMAAELIQTLIDKLIRRHPHVFGDVQTKNADAALKQWNAIKASEKKKTESRLDGIAKALTSLQMAQKLGKRSHEVAFDWDTPEQVWKQVESELDELKEARSLNEKEHEIGDVFFSLVQWARHEKIDPEVALSSANQRFTRRFKKMEEFCAEKNLNFDKLGLEEKEELWKRAKKET